MKRSMLNVLLFACVISAQQTTDWPTYGRTSERNRSSSIALQGDLSLQWKWHAPQPPAPAWEGPAKWDAYNKVHNLEARLFFDRAFALVSSDGRVFFGSSADDQLRCLSADDGRLLWSYFAGGPIRLAPVYSKGRVFVGSDDGFVHCVSASKGELIWKSRLGPSERTVIGNERIVSVWPVRTGLSVERGLVHVACGLFPAEGAWLVALNATDGSTVWKQKVPRLSPQGYIMVAGDRIVLPASRAAPYVFERETGKLVHGVKGNGGTFAVLSGEMLICGPGKTGQLSVFRKDEPVALLTLNANRLAISGPIAYLQSDQHLEMIDLDRAVATEIQMGGIRQEQKKHSGRLKKISALLKSRQRKVGEQMQPIPEEELENLAEERTTVTEALIAVGAQIDSMADQRQACRKWRVNCDEALCLIVVGGRIVTGGRGRIAIREAATGALIKQHEVDGDAWDVIVVDGTVLVSTSQGTIHSFKAIDGGAR